MKCSVAFLVLALVIHNGWSIDLVNLLHQLPAESEPYYCIVQSGTERHLVQEVFEDISKNGHEQTVVTSHDFHIAHKKVSHFVITFDGDNWESIDAMINHLFYHRGWNNLAYFIFLCESEFDYETMQHYGSIAKFNGITKSVVIFSDNRSFGYDLFTHSFWYISNSRMMIYHLLKDHLMDLQGYALKISVVDYHLSISLTYNPLRVKGPIAQVLEAFANRINGTIEWIVDDMTPSNVHHQILRNKIDIITNRSFKTPLLTSVYENNFHGIVLMIPEKLRATFFKQLLTPFTNAVWIFVLVLFIICVSLNNVLKKLFPHNILLFLFFGSASEHNLPKIERSTFISISFVVFLLREAYVAKMLSYLLYVQYESHLATLEEFEQTTIPVCTTFKISDEYREMVLNLSPNLVERLVELNDSNHRRRIDDGSCSWLASHQIARDYVEYKENHDPITLRKKMYMMPQILGWNPSQHSVSRTNPYVSGLSITYQRIYEAGLLQHWRQQAKQPFFLRKLSTLTVLGYEDLLSLWYILGYGFALSGAIFMTEVGIKPIKELQKKIRNMIKDLRKKVRRMMSKIRARKKNIKKQTIIQVKPKQSNRKVKNVSISVKS